MPKDATELLSEALELTPQARAALAATLLDSLDASVDEDAEHVWGSVIERRIEELDSGAVTSMPWEEALRRLRCR